MRILIAEDDQALGNLLVRSLRAGVEPVRAGKPGEPASPSTSLLPECELSRDGNEAVSAFLRREPDLIILDLQLPGRSGLEVLEIVRKLSASCLILVLSGRAESETRTACLDLGADDCLQKPFSLGELRARCRALLRRSGITEQTLAQARLEASTLRLGSLCLERTRRVVALEGRPLHLTNREYALLEQLVLAKGAAVSRGELMAAVWGGEAGATNALDVHMAALRRKLLACPGRFAIATERGAGFRAVPDLPSRALGQGDAGMVVPQSMSFGENTLRDLEDRLEDSLKDSSDHGPGPGLEADTESGVTAQAAVLGFTHRGLTQADAAGEIGATR